MAQQVSMQMRVLVQHTVQEPTLQNTAVVRNHKKSIKAYLETVLRLAPLCTVDTCIILASHQSSTNPSSICVD